MSQPSPSFQTLMMLWACLLGSHFMLLVPLFVVPSQQPPDPTLPFILAPLAFGVAAASLFVPTRLFNASVAGKNIAMVQAPDPNALPGFGKAVESPKDPDGTRRSLLPAYQIHMIVGCALAEAVTLFGFMMKLLGFGWEFAAPCFLLGILLCVVHMPSEKKLVAAIERALGAPLRRG